jgi:hypothetical protein
VKSDVRHGAGIDANHRVLVIALAISSFAVLAAILLVIKFWPQRSRDASLEWDVMIDNHVDVSNSI